MKAFISYPLLGNIIRFRTEDNRINFIFNKADEILSIDLIKSIENGILTLSVSVKSDDNTHCYSTDMRINLVSKAQLLDIPDYKLLYNISDVFKESWNEEEEEYQFTSIFVDGKRYIKATSPELPGKSAIFDVETLNVIAADMPFDMVAKCIEIHENSDELTMDDIFGEEFATDDFFSNEEDELTLEDIFNEENVFTDAFYNEDEALSDDEDEIFSDDIFEDDQEACDIGSLIINDEDLF